MRTKIAKWGNSAGVRVPLAMLKTARLAIGDDVDLSAESGVLRLRKPRRIPTIQELFAEYEKRGPLEPPEAVDWGPDRGAEIIDEDWSDIAPADEEMGISDGAGRRANSRGR